MTTALICVNQFTKHYNGPVPELTKPYQKP